MIGEGNFFSGSGACHVGEFCSEQPSDSYTIIVPYARSATPSTWLGDSGATNHISRDRNVLRDLREYKGNCSIQHMQGSVPVTHIGTVVLKVDGESGKEEMVLHDVLLVESMKFNIFSLQKARMLEYQYGFEKATEGKVTLLQKLDCGTKLQIALFTESNGRWTLDAKVLPSQNNITSPASMLLNNPPTAPLHGQSRCYAGGQLGPKATLSSMHQQ